MICSFKTFAFGFILEPLAFVEDPGFMHGKTYSIYIQFACNSKDIQNLRQLTCMPFRPNIA